MATDVLPPPAEGLSPTAFVAMLRNMVPCESTDPLLKDAYERALREWAGMKPWLRDAEGFVRYWEAEAARASGL